VDVVLVLVAVVAVLVICPLPLALLAVAERQPWPRQLRFLRAAHHAEVGLQGALGVSMTVGTIVHVVEGVRPAEVVVVGETGERERFALDPTTDPAALRRLRYWRAEAIPVLVVHDTRDEVVVHGPSGVVVARHAGVVRPTTP